MGPQNKTQINYKSGDYVTWTPSVLSILKWEFLAAASKAAKRFLEDLSGLANLKGPVEKRNFGNPKIMLIRMGSCTCDPCFCVYNLPQLIFCIFDFWWLTLCWEARLNFQKKLTADFFNWHFHPSMSIVHCARRQMMMSLAFWHTYQKWKTGEKSKVWGMNWHLDCQCHSCQKFTWRWEKLIWSSGPGKPSDFFSYVVGIFWKIDSWHFYIDIFQGSMV